MMKLLALTPDEFQTLALGWVTALTAFVLAIGFAVAKVWPVIADLKARYDALHDRADRQGARQNAQDATVTKVALAVQAPTLLPTVELAAPVRKTDS